MIKFIRSLFRNKLKERVEALEKEIVVREKYSGDTFYYNMLNLSKSPADTIGIRVKMLENLISRDTTASRVSVNIKYSCIDEEDGSSYKTSHTMKLNDVITLLLDHCGLEILPPKQEAGIVAKKNK